MDVVLQSRSSNNMAAEQEEEAELRRGPWTVDEDLTLINYISDHGEGRWNALARAAGLRRTGKSCRLRWLNYLRPDVKRGNFTADEQLLILDLHSRWGNRWSKIAQHLPGRTDNEIKNYWRTRVQKHAKQLNCDVGSPTFKDAMRYLWMPRLVERIHAAATTATGGEPSIGDTSCASGVTLMATAVATATACPENNSPASAVTSRSASSGSITSELCGDEKNLHVHGNDDKTTSGGDWPMQDVDQEFWAMHMQIQPDDGGLFQDHELSGWVQGFSDVGVSADNLWSLEDIWKMQ
ncbi:transcription factor JAMYB-like [Hordeum vulgare subsp. vulgare]|uniref:Uncharacterized protein n=1 Tax=Hordeum vulgare subsp. vulgare TaxID=112509 RepID=A0A287NNV8_HORVV|nr:transcription factor JAMYB-like [Hordeum vulgare subsp. vulgare]